MGAGQAPKCLGPIFYEVTFPRYPVVSCAMSVVYTPAPERAGELLWIQLHTGSFQNPGDDDEDYDDDDGLLFVAF